MGSFEEKKLYFIESKKKVAIITIMLNTEVDRLEKHEITMLMYSACPYIILSVLKTSKCIEGRRLQQLDLHHVVVGEEIVVHLERV